MKKVYALLPLFFILIFFTNWGFLVHRTINQLAVYQLPAKMRPYFYHQMEYLVKHAVRPDLRRAKDSTEAPRHFIDFEAYGDSAAWKMPHNWQAAVKKYTIDTLQEYGYVPYHIIWVKDRLTEAFRQKSEDSILFYAAEIGHYIGDAHVPLHTTINYDGQLTGQKGLHGLWETTIPEIELAGYDLSSKHEARYLKNPAETIWATVQQTRLLVPDVLRLEKEVSAAFTPETKYRTQMRKGRAVKSYTSAFAKAYSSRLQPTINVQLTCAANTIANFWYTAWVDGGKPEISALLTKAVLKNDKADLKVEVKEFKKNQLLTNKKLVARKGQADRDE